VDVRRREHAIISCYHEAGHAVMAWYSGLRILYVTMASPDDTAHAGLTATAEDDTISLVRAEVRMKVASAGEIAQNWRLPNPEELADVSLLRRFARDEKVAGASGIPRFDDRLIFAWWGRTRDELIRNAASGEATGLPGWLSVFRSAEQLIRDGLWPAVEAVAEKLSWSASDLSHEDVARLAATALNRAEELTGQRD
jgi:hypothetical protein